MSIDNKLRERASLPHIECGADQHVAKLTESADYAFAQANYSPERLWEFFDGDRASLNIAHECIDRHATDARR